MKAWWIGVVAVALVAAGLPDTSEARRFGGGAGSGMQRSMPERTAPQAPAPAPRPAQQPGTPAQQPGAAAPAAAGAAASTAGRSWMGPLAGLAAGLGIAALLSHMGLGGAFAEFLMLALLLVGGFFLVRFLMRRMGAPAPAAQAAQGAGLQRQAPAMSAPAAVQAPVQRSPLPQATPADSGLQGHTGAGASLPPLNPVLPADGSAPVAAEAAQPAAPAMPAVFVPATFDSEGFARVAKAIFLRLQAANDAGDLDDIRRFTTPEMFAEARLQLQERGDAAQATDVRSVEAEVLDVAEEDGRQVVSVRYRGEIVEEAGQEPQPFDEVWHLVKPLDDSRSWAIAGIEQMR